jgi:hypothetical protein
MGEFCYPLDDGALPETEAPSPEVERRHAEIKSGAVTPLPGPETLAELEAEFA